VHTPVSSAIPALLCPSAASNTIRARNTNRGAVVGARTSRASSALLRSVNSITDALAIDTEPCWSRGLPDTVGEEHCIAGVETRHQFLACNVPGPFITPVVSDVTFAIRGEGEQVGDQGSVKPKHLASLVDACQSASAACHRRVGTHKEETARGRPWARLNVDQSPCGFRLMMTRTLCRGDVSPMMWTDGGANADLLTPYSARHPSEALCGGRLARQACRRTRGWRRSRAERLPPPPRRPRARQ
jgi:hypothetical protein